VSAVETPAQEPSCIYSVETRKKTHRPAISAGTPTDERRLAGSVETPGQGCLADSAETPTEQRHLADSAETATQQRRLVDSGETQTER